MADAATKRFAYSSEDDAVLLARARALADACEDREETVTDLLCFELSGEVCAIETGVIRHLLRGDACHPVPFAPPFLRGIAYYRGAFLAVIDLQELLGAPPPRRKGVSHLAIVGNGDDHVCLALDGIPQPFAAPARDRRALPPDAPPWLRDVACAAWEGPAGRVALLSVPALLAHPLLAIQSESAARRAASC